MVGWLVPGWKVDGFGTALLVALGLTALGMIATTVFLASDRPPYNLRRIRRLGRRAAPTEADRSPGLIILEIDGLSEPILRRALREGQMPTLQGWLDSGSHALVAWESDLPSQTSAMQAGILHGSHFNIPAFRWYDKAARRLLVSNRARDAAVIVRPLLNGQGLLRREGFALNNWASGDAERVVLTFTTLTDPRLGVRAQEDNLYGYFANIGNLPRAIVVTLRDVVIEVLEGWRQRLTDVRPRVHRGGVYPLLRAATTGLLPELGVYLMIEKILNGVGSAYTTFVSYDEVAHHSGIDRPDAFRVLRQLDRQIGWITAAARQAPRPYEFVVLSDHGQSMGATFRQRYGQTLAELVTSLVGDQAAQPAPADHESWGYVNALLSELTNSRQAAATPIRQALQRHTDTGVVELGSHAGHEEVGAARTVVCASGNLGLVYFTDWPERLTLEQIKERFPTLLEGLAAHPGIGFIMARSEADGVVVLGKHGLRLLERDEVRGDDPLADFGPHAAQHLLELAGYPSVGDLVVNSLYLPATGEVAAFEELVGSHGGLGGTQTRPFLLYPTRLAAEPPQIVGAPGVYAVLRRWLAMLQGEAAGGPEPGD